MLRPPNLPLVYLRNDEEQEKCITPPHITNKTVPLIIHYIWLGNPLTTKQVERMIKCVVKKSTGFKFIIWTDNKSFYCRMNAVASGFFHEENRPSSEKNMEVRFIDHHFKHIHDRNYVFFKRESIGAYRNYAAASDILRLLILYYFGGVYLDVDVELKSELDGKAVQSICGFSVREINNKVEEIQNAIISAAPKHPWVKLLLDSIKKSYSAGKKIDDYYHEINPHNLTTWSTKRSGLTYNPVSKKSIWEFSDYNARLEATAIITGPKLFYNILNENKLIQHVGIMDKYFKAPDAYATWRTVKQYNGSDSC